MGSFSSPIYPKQPVFFPLLIWIIYDGFVCIPDAFRCHIPSTGAWPAKPWVLHLVEIGWPKMRNPNDWPLDRTFHVGIKPILHLTWIHPVWTSNIFWNAGIPVFGLLLGLMRQACLIVKHMFKGFRRYKGGLKDHHIHSLSICIKNLYLQ